MTIRRVAILGSQRIPFARSFGAYSKISNQELMETVLQGIVKKYKLEGATLGEVALGAVMNHSSDWNLARECVLGSGLSAKTPGLTVQQACGTGLAAAIVMANKIALGQMESAIAGGVDTNSDLPIVFSREFGHKMIALSRAKTTTEKLKVILTIRPTDFKPIQPMVVEPRTGLSMGQSCELMAKTWKVTREEQDELALRSQMNAVKAYKDGFYNDLLTPMADLTKDNNVRESTMEKMAQLKPAFDRSGAGTMTAANSTALTDGASGVLFASEEWAKSRGLPVLAYMTYSETAAVDFVKAEGLLMAPTYAVSSMLKRAQLTLQDFDLYEIHEAFAAQVLCTLKAWEDPSFCKERLGRSEPLGEIDRSKMNIKGGSIALGHPFAATGGRILGSLAKMLSERKKGRGLVSICTGGGMGVTAILEGPEGVR